MLTVSRLDADGVAVGALNDFESLEWTESLSASGASLTCDARLAADLASGGLHISDSVTGHVWTCHAVEASTQSDGNGHVTFDSDLTWLAKIQPHPSPIDLNGATQARDVHTGAAGAVLAALIDRNCGQAANVTRRRFTVVTSGGTAPTTTIRARWTPSLLEWVQRKGGPNGVAVSLTRNPSTGAGTVNVRTCVERDVVFTETSALSWRRTARMPTVTHLWAGGTGELTARLIRSGSSPDGPRLEGFLDRRNVSDAAELDKEIAEALWLGRRTVALEIELTDSGSVTYGRDFLLGDTVRLWVGDDEYLEPVTSVRSRVTAAGLERHVTVGFAPLDPRVSGRVEARRAAARLDDIEGEA